MRLARILAFALGVFVLVDQSMSASFLVHIYIVPPPEEPEIDVQIDFFDADDGASLGGDTRKVDGSTSVKVAISPNENTKRVRIKFQPINIKNWAVKPSERIIDLKPLMYAKTVTWLAGVTDDKAYLDNVTTARQSLNKKDIEEAIDRSAYAGALATTGNQRLEAARVEASGYLAKNDPYSALTVFDKVVNEGFDKADPSKKKVFVGEWFDILERAAKGEGTIPDKKTGLIFTSLRPNSKLRDEFFKFTKVFAQVVPTFKDKASNIASSDIASLEKLVRADLSSIIGDLSRRPKAKR